MRKQPGTAAMKAAGARASARRGCERSSGRTSHLLQGLDARLQRCLTIAIASVSDVVAA